MSAGGVADQITLFCSQVQRRRFDDGTLRILELLLVSKDVKSLVEIRCRLREFMRSEAVCVLQEISEKTVEQKLLVLEFFVRAFALAGDVESCMTLKYEALILREQTSMKNEWLRVSYDEWLTFAQASFDNGFYQIAVKSCENALSCILAEEVDSIPNIYLASAQVVNRIKKLKAAAVSLVASHSVQAQTAKHLKKKAIQLNQKSHLVTVDTQCLSSSAFRSGIKKQNLKRLTELQRQQNESQVQN